MNFEDVQKLWRSQEAHPPFSVDEYVLRYVVDQRRKELSRFFLRELVVVYGSALFMLGFTSFLFLVLYFDDDPRTVLDFLPVLGAAATFLIWAIGFQVTHARRKRLEPSFTCSLREAIERDLQRIDYEISRRTPFKHVLMMTGLPLVSAFLTVVASLQVNNMAPPAWLVPYLILMGVGGFALQIRSVKRVLARRLYPRRQELQALRDKLN
ncbi:MAG: hypothetical protein WDO68_18500 [Gammaproteobacteria bacterium]